MLNEEEAGSIRRTLDGNYLLNYKNNLKKIPAPFTFNFSNDI